MVNVVSARWNAELQAKSSRVLSILSAPSLLSSSVLLYVQRSPRLPSILSGPDQCVWWRCKVFQSFLESWLNKIMGARAGLSAGATALLVLWHVHVCFVFKIALVMVWACLHGLLALGRFDQLFFLFVACPWECVCQSLHGDGLFLGCGKVVCKCNNLSVLTMSARVFVYDCVGYGRCMSVHFAPKLVVFVDRWMLICLDIKHSC